MTVFRSEVERITSRRATKVAAGVLTLGLFAIGGTTFLSHTNAAPDMAAARRLAAENTAGCMSWASEPDSGIAAADIATTCFSDPLWYVDDPKFHMNQILAVGQDGQSWTEITASIQERGDVYKVQESAEEEPVILPVQQASYGFSGGLVSFATALSLLAAVLGATYVGADWRSGIIESQMVRIPNRRRLIGGKFAAIGAVSAAGSMLFTSLYVAAVTPSAIWRGDFGVADGAFWMDVIGVTFRTAAMAAMMAIIGGGLALLARNTVAGVVGVLVAFIGGSFLINTPGRWTAFITLGENTNAFIARADVAYILEQSFQGALTWDRVVGHGYLAAGLLLATAAAGALLFSGASFLHRDVS